MERIPEVEVMDTWEEAREYDAMDFTQVNQEFAELAIELGPETGLILDAGTGTARIPIIIAKQRSRSGVANASQWQITGIDLSANMLFIGNQNIEEAGLQEQIKLEQIDAKQLPYPDDQFDMVISNSIVHHLSEPLLFFQELQRVLKPQGGIFLRDLARPSSETELNTLVEQYAGDCNDHQKKLFRDSLQAAYTLDEIINLSESAGLENMRIYQSSDRHWTAERPYRVLK